MFDTGYVHSVDGQTAEIAFGGQLVDCTIASNIDTDQLIENRSVLVYFPSQVIVAVWGEGASSTGMVEHTNDWHSEDYIPAVTKQEVPGIENTICISPTDKSVTIFADGHWRTLVEWEGAVLAGAGAMTIAGRADYRASAIMSGVGTMIPAGTVISTEEQTANNTNTTLRAGGNVRVGQRLTISDRYVSDLSFLIHKTNAPTGDVTFTIRKVSDDSIIGSKVWGDAADLPTWSVGFSTWTTATFASPIHVNEEVYILVEYSGGDAWDLVELWYQNTDVKADEYFARYTDSWTHVTGSDCAYKYTYEGAA